MNSRASMQNSKQTWLRNLGFGLGILALAPLVHAQAPGQTGAPAAQAQNAGVPSRITQAVDETNRITLRGNTHPLARPQFDQGAVADSQSMNRMLLLLQRSSDQETALRGLLDQQQSKASPSYHQWLTPQQFGQQFGPSDADVQTVTAWLQSNGFQVNRVSAGKTVIEFSGNAGQLRAAFNTEIHRYRLNGETHFANASDPQIPAALAPVLAGPVSMNNFGRKALNRIGGLAETSPGANGSTPELTDTCRTGSGTVFTCYVVAPADFATIYNTATLLSSSPSIDGTGQTIAIVADSNINCVDVKNFRNFFSLPVSTPTNNGDCTQATSNVQVILDGPDPGLTPDEIEADLDTQWSGAVAPGAHIDLVASENTESSAGIDLSAEYIIDNNLASIMSVSFGACEHSLGNGGAGFYEGLWEQAAAQGITAIVSAGDSGAAGCDDDDVVDVSTHGLAVSGIASTPFDVAVGGTDFNDFFNQTTYWNSVNTGMKSVKSYIPEIPWDDSCAATAAVGCNGLSISNPGASLNIVAGGGGQSNCVTQNTSGVCTAGFPKPAWQSGKAVTGLASTDSVRDIPDVSLFAAAGSGSDSFYPVCESDTPGGACPNGFIGVGGTSSSAPAFAGMMAMVNEYMASQSMPSRQGNANYVLYALASSQVSTPPANGCNSTMSPNTASSTGCTFYDITLASNSVPCIEGLGCTIQNANANAPGVLDEVTSGSPNGTLAWQAGTG
jgi:subtilase family serine protease